MNLYTKADYPEATGLYNPSREHESCGLAFVADIGGKRSHQIVKDGLSMLVNLTHRGAAGADPDTGDGAGMMTEIPWAFFESQGVIKKSSSGVRACAQIFLPDHETEALSYRNLIGDLITGNGHSIVTWRRVPVCQDAIGAGARKSEPQTWQIFIELNGTESEFSDHEFRLYLLRKLIERGVESSTLNDKDQFWICSLSSQKIVYKGMFLARQLSEYYTDLKHELFESAWSVVHQRFSTNTFPAWKLAHPYRVCAHNGEFNTITGNMNLMSMREHHLRHPVFNDLTSEQLHPLIQDGLSDSGSFDQALEFLLHTNRSLAHSMCMMIPEAWSSREHMDINRKNFYQFHAQLMEPWDGPAAVVGCHNHQIVASLDRNGLRPARYCLTRDNRIIFGSEAGMLALDDEMIIFKGRLWPGKMILIDMNRGSFFDDDEAKRTSIHDKPWDRWIDETLVTIDELPDPVKAPKALKHQLEVYQKCFCWTQEELKTQLIPMAISGQEPMVSMGYDSPMAVMSEHHQLLFDYFRQKFAQVTNPPIDPVREELVMNMSSYFGAAWNMFDQEKPAGVRLKLLSPVLTNYELETLAQTKNASIRGTILSITCSVKENSDGLEQAIRFLCEKAEQKIHLGYNVLILSDRNLSKDLAGIPVVLAVSALHQFLIKKGLRAGVGLIIESAQVRLVHHFAVLLSYGANGINPYLAFESIRSLRSRELLPGQDGNEIDYEDPCAKYDRNYIQSVHKGLFKIMSKMGISTLKSYFGARTFEIFGFSQELSDRYFGGTLSAFGGPGLSQIWDDAKRSHQNAFREPGVLPFGGLFQWSRDGERHLNHPETIAKIQHAVRQNSWSLYKEYSSRTDKAAGDGLSLRGMLRIKRMRKPVSVDSVESESEIVKRFVTGAMSLGALSKEAHENLAIAMNRLGGKSNSGEGGEDPERFEKDPDGNNRISKIKQIASGRFGVTTDYLTRAEELQIKISQGAKPGEGGQLPGHKVSSYIAKLRFSVPGVSLISPPPHHDIYSIEDLAQLIFDLKCVNPEAKISVKLVSESGVGTVAAGVAKAFADTIIISGHDGGTGASPMSSVRNAGMPWEIGLSETRQTLLLNQLRHKVKLQVDGQLKTGRDIIVAALLGADEFGFATLPLIAQGCLLMRKCHLDTCPVGIATQNPELRKNFSGTPEHIERLMLFLAREVREHLAELGYRSLEEIIGRSDLLSYEAQGTRADTFSWNRLTAMPQGTGTVKTNDTLSGNALSGHDDLMDHQMISQLNQDRQDDGPVRLKFIAKMKSSQRSIGTSLSGWVSKHIRKEGLDDESIHVVCEGSAGQSFGAFLAKGIILEGIGEANDYLGKGMSGGRILLYQKPGSRRLSHENWIAGNTLLYGATGGEVYRSGQVVERFAVRNSGCIAVVEGVGDHGCEYMTGGRVIVLGHTGRNFAAGMSGGIAFVFDQEGLFRRRYNPGMVDLEPMNDDDEVFVTQHLGRHFQFTGSLRAKSILDAWDDSKDQFVKIMPREYKRALQRKSLTERRIG